MNKKILVVEDEPLIVNMVKHRLEKHHFDVVEAFEGEEGLEKAKNEKPDLIILDIIMPKMDGYTFVKKLKRDEDTRNIPIIILTAWEKMEDLFLQEGIKDYLVKPFKAEELLARIHKYLPEESRNG